MISLEEAAAVAMTAEAAMPDPVAMALSMKSLTVDLPLAIATEAVRFNVRVATAWLDHIGRVTALSQSGVDDMFDRKEPGICDVAVQPPFAIATRLAA
jgi:hypothetical protein